MTIEEKRNVIKNYCTGRECKKCVLQFRPQCGCYEGKIVNGEILEENYKLVMEDMQDETDAGIVEELKKCEREKSREYITEDKGSLTITGTYYDDVLNILCRNGYKTTMITEPSKEELGKVEHAIVFWKEK